MKFHRLKQYFKVLFLLFTVKMDENLLSHSDEVELFLTDSEQLDHFRHVSFFLFV
jgi:hypothetical protein